MLNFIKPEAVQNLKWMFIIETNSESQIKHSSSSKEMQKNQNIEDEMLLFTIPFCLIDSRYMYHSITPFEILPLIQITIVMEKHHNKIGRQKLKVQFNR